MKVNILGTKYTITESDPQKDKLLETLDGYCDKTTKSIVVNKQMSDSDLGDIGVYLRQVLRHEIVHAFLFESGLHGNFEHKKYGHEETVVDWIAVQFPKLQAAFEEAGCSEP